MRVAAHQMGVPRSSLGDRVTKKSTEPTSFGHCKVLTMAEEEKVANWLELMAAIGHPVTKYQLCDKVQELILSDGRKNPFVDGRPGSLT